MGDVVIKRLLLLIGLTGMLVGLGSCDWWSGRSRDESRARYDQRMYEQRIYDQRIARERKAAAAARERRERGEIYDDYGPPYGSSSDWLTLDYACSGALRRAQWLVCEHESLGLLHRKLALQWEAARRVASPERVSVLIAQQNAFLGERNACEDIACVATAYHRYLDGRSTYAKPWVNLDNYHYGPKRAVKWVRRRANYCDDRHGHNSYCRRGDAPPRPPHEQRSCISEIGFAAASQLADRCDSVTRGLSSQCSVNNSCAGIQAQTDRGCNTNRDRRGICRNR